MSHSPSVHIEAHRRKFRAIWRDPVTGDKHRVPFDTRFKAEVFQALSRRNPVEQVAAFVDGQLDPSELDWQGAPTAPTAATAAEQPAAHAPGSPDAATEELTGDTVPRPFAGGPALP